MDNAKHLSNHNDEMLAKTVKRLLDPVALNIDESNCSKESSVLDRAPGNSGIDKEPSSVLPVQGYDNSSGDEMTERPSVLLRTATFASRVGTEPRSAAPHDVQGTRLESPVSDEPSVLELHPSNHGDIGNEPSSALQHQVQPHDEELHDTVDVDQRQRSIASVDKEPSSVSSISLSVQHLGNTPSIIQLQQGHPFQPITAIVGNMKIGYCGVHAASNYTGKSA